jgi:hypothetical protein
MDRPVPGPVSHFRDGTGSQIKPEGTGGNARAGPEPDEHNMTQEELKRRATYKTLTIVVLVLVVLAIYIGSFFLVTG